MKAKNRNQWNPNLKDIRNSHPMESLFSTHPANDDQSNNKILSSDSVFMALLPCFRRELVTRPLTATFVCLVLGHSSRSQTPTHFRVPWSTLFATHSARPLTPPGGDLVDVSIFDFSIFSFSSARRSDDTIAVK